MKHIIIFLVLITLTLKLYSQKVYYGYPSNYYELNKGDVIITIIPRHLDGRFIETEDFDNLINLLKIDTSIVFKIEINFFFFSDENYNLAYSGHLCNNLKEIIKLNTSVTNYNVINNGSSNPIFCNKDGLLYNLLNTRIEITID
jgi:hypothetical protein